MLYLHICCHAVEANCLVFDFVVEVVRYLGLWFGASMVDSEFCYVVLAGMHRISGLCTLAVTYPGLVFVALMAICLGFGFSFVSGTHYVSLEEIYPTTGYPGAYVVVIHLNYFDVSRSRLVYDLGICFPWLAMMRMIDRDEVKDLGYWLA